jgi:hypothetical protein
MENKKNATFIKSLDGFRGDARLYKLNPPLEDRGYSDDEIKKHEFVIVSAVNAMFSGPETYIFPATSDGEVVDYGELDGSFKGDQDHARALENAGYEVSGL